MTTPRNDDPEIVRARRPGGGWALLAGVVFGLLLILLLDRDGLPWLTRQLHILPLQDALSLLRWIFYSAASVFAVLGLVVARQAWRTLSSGSWPPPRSFVLVDTQVVHGLAARIRAAALVSVAALLFAGALGLSLFPGQIERVVTNSGGTINSELPLGLPPLPACDSWASDSTDQPEDCDPGDDE